MRPGFSAWSHGGEQMSSGVINIAHISKHSGSLLQKLSEKLYTFQFVLLLVILAGCTPRSDHDEVLLIQAHTQGQEDRWGQVTPLARILLLQHPHHPVGHFLLGTSYARVANPYIVAAEGELNIALNSFIALEEAEQQDILGPLNAIYTPETFIATIYTELARLHMRIFHQGTSYRIPPHILRQHMERALLFVEDGIVLDPNSKTLQMMQETLLAILQEKPLPEWDDNYNRVPDTESEPDGSTSLPEPEPHNGTYI